MRVSVNWLKDFVKINPPFEKIAEDLTMAGLEVKKVEPSGDQKDTLFEIEITSNRPDWLSHLGVAREIAAVQNLPLMHFDVPKALNRPMPAGWKINLKDLEACPYYTGVYIEGIQNLPTPDFIKERLAACGLRSIHVVVDITNYVLLEIGQPLHAFDADLIKGQEILIRRARPEEKFSAINGTEFSLLSQDLVIGDSDKALALAGIMGGKNSEVTERTRNLFLESAFFLPRFVRQTSRRTGLVSDSSYRFERRVDPDGVDLARERAIALIQQYAKPRFISAVLKAGQKPTALKSSFHLSVTEVNQKLGSQLKSHQILSILTRLGFETRQDSTEQIKVEIPSFRSDVTEAIDLIEEVARIHGFDQLPETLPARACLSLGQAPLYRVEDTVRNYLSGTGFYETVTFSLIAAHGLDAEEDLRNAVFVNNPQNSELCWMRPFFSPSLCQVIAKNRSWGALQIPIFEIANLYRIPAGEKFPLEVRTLGFAIAGKVRAGHWLEGSRDYTFYDLKGWVLGVLSRCRLSNIEFRPAPKPFMILPASEEIWCEGECLGYYGEINPRQLKTWDVDLPVFTAELDLEKVAQLASKQRALYREVPRFPSVERDLSLVVSDSVRSGTIEHDILELAGGLAVSVELFDLFKGSRVPKGYKNLAYRVTYQSSEKTLLAEEVQKLHMQIAEILVKKYQAAFQ